MTAIYSWLFWVFLSLLISTPTFIFLFKKKAYSHWVESLLWSYPISHAQFFLIALFLFYLKVPISDYGWVAAYMGHLSLTWILTIKSSPDKRPSRPWGHLSWAPKACALALCIFCALFVLNITRKSFVYTDSQFYWFGKAATFMNVHDIYAFRFLHGPTYPLLIPLAYNFFLRANTGIGVAALTPTLLATSVLGLGLPSLRKARLGLPILALFVVSVPLLYRDELPLLYADVALAVFFALTLAVLSDILAGKKRNYEAAVLSLAVAATKLNGEYLIGITILSFSLFYLTSCRSMIVGVKQILCIFSPVIAYLGLQLILRHTYNLKTIFQVFAVPVIQQEILTSPDPFKVYGAKLAASIKYAFFLATQTDRKVFLIFFLGMPLVIRSTSPIRFLYLTVGAVILFTIGIVYSLIPYDDRQWWFDTGYWRTLSHTGFAVYFTLYTVVLRLTSNERSQAFKGSITQ